MSPADPVSADTPAGGASPPPGAASARRIVCLVPSLTEALYALGLGERVVGVTDWCVHPARAVAALPRVGGTKTPDLDRLQTLEPDLVIANHEENRRRDVDRLQTAGIPVWVTYPRTVAQGVALLAQLADLGADEAHVARVLRPVQEALATAEQARRALSAPRRVFCPIWRDPWMSVGGDTYAHDLLTLCGGENVFADHGDRRYPRVELTSLERAAPEVILLPDEPYCFGPADVSELRSLDTPASRDGSIHLIDGTFVSWYGPRIREAIQTLRGLIAAIGSSDV